MQPRAVFELLKTDDPDIFAIKVSGHLTPRQRGVVEQFVEKCEQAGKRKVVFDFSELESLGGGVAQVLGEFAMSLAREGSPPWFVGARDIVRKFLTARFSEGEPRFASSLEQACARLSSGKDDGEDGKDEGADFLQIVDAVNETAASVQHPEEVEEAPRTELAPASVKTVAQAPARPEREEDPNRFITLDDALSAFAKMSRLDEAGPVLQRLLHSSSLASRSWLFLHTPSGFSHGELHFPVDGVLATVVERRHGPMDLVDFVELDLEVDEIEVLESINCQVCVPIFGPRKLEGICFLSKVQVGDEYTAAEIFALESLSRQVTQSIWADSPAPAPAPATERNRRSRTLQRVARQLHESGDQEAILSRLAHGLIGEMGITGVTALGLDADGISVHAGWGQRAADSMGTVAAETGAWDELEAPVQLAGHDAPWAEALHDAGCSWFAVLDTGGDRRIGLAFSLRDPDDDSSLDPDALESLLVQAGLAFRHCEALEQARSRTLLVSRTLVSLIEKRLGHESSGETALVAEYVARLADRMNIDHSDLPDLLYGTIMRDVGMIEISDLVLKSPRTLSPEEWKLVQRHPIAGAEILRRMGFSEAACEVVRHHHERFNGEGYPDGLRGTAIPVGARMVSVVESFVAMLRETPYRPALSEEEALSVLNENWEMRYDPNVIEQFIALKQVDGGSMDIDALLVGQTPD